MTTKQHWEVEVRNLPDHIIKEDLAYFLWKCLESCHALPRNGNPVNMIIIIDYTICVVTIESVKIKLQKPVISNELSSPRSYLLCIYFTNKGKKVLFITSRFLAVNKQKNINLDKLKIVKSQPQDKFRQLYVGNLPYMNSMEILNYLS